MIKIGNDKIGAVYHGGNPISKIYKGGELVFKSGPRGLTLTCETSHSDYLINFNGVMLYPDVVANVPLFVELNGVCNSLAFIPNNDIKSLIFNLDTSSITSMYGMFRGSYMLTDLDVSCFNTSNVTDMSSMFIGCSALTSLDLSMFDTPKVTNINSMFQGCSKLTTLDLSKFDISKVNGYENIVDTFYRCSALTHIKCKQAFKDWCITNATEISLPAAMQEGGSGTWEIVD